MSHYLQVCEYGKVHGQCRCPGPKKTIEVKCSTPNRHNPFDTSQLKPTPVLKAVPSFDEDEVHDFTEVELADRLTSLVKTELWWMQEHLRDDLVTKIMAEVTI